MRIYIASSWKNQHAVEMLTAMLREDGHRVESFVEKASGAEDRAGRIQDINDWIASKDGLAKFEYDTQAATTCDLVVYVGPSGMDAWAEVGAAFGSKIPIVGLWAKGEQIGLNRHMVRWYKTAIELVTDLAVDPNCPEIAGDIGPAERLAGIERARGAVGIATERCAQRLKGLVLWGAA